RGGPVPVAAGNPVHLPSGRESLRDRSRSQAADRIDRNTGRARRDSFSIGAFLRSPHPGARRVPEELSQAESGHVAVQYPVRTYAIVLAGNAPVRKYHERGAGGRNRSGAGRFAGADSIY